MMDQYEKIRIETSCGPVVGKKWKDGGIFLGIPFGKAKRFRAPEPVCWNEPLPCFSYGDFAPQPAHRGVRPSESEIPFEMAGAEDCLNLNVWTPGISREEKLPVVVYVYGGAFQYGKNSAPDFAGDHFMGNEEMVYISVNYRVGVMGFLELGDAVGPEYAGSGNCGMHDLLLAVRWVKENCARFGGDPERVILMGISAGAKAIGALATHPEIQESCHRLILESGGTQSFRTVETAEETARRFLELLPEDTDILTAPAEQILEAQAEFCAVDGNTCFFGPVLEAPFDENWEDAWRGGACFRGKAIIGTNRHELIRQAVKKHTDEEFRQLADELFGVGGALAEEMALEREGEGLSMPEAWEPVLSDFMYRYYGNELARRLEADGNEVWSYSFDYGESCHGMGFAFLGGNITPPGQQLSESEEREARYVSDVMREKILAWIREDGAAETEWPKYRGGNKMIFDEHPRVEFRPDDTLTGFPAQVYRLEKG